MEEVAILVLICLLKSRSTKNNTYYKKTLLMLLIWLQIQEKMRELFLVLKQEEKRELALKQEGKMPKTLVQFPL